MPKAKKQTTPKKEKIVVTTDALEKVVKDMQDTLDKGMAPEPAYQITLVLGDELYKGSGNTMLEALRSMEQPVKVTTKGVLKATSGDKAMQTVLIVPKVKRLFHPLAQTIVAKQLNYLLR